jgi:signal transduction histidine kinase/DNA-binding response OmpR family regulator
MAGPADRPGVLVVDDSPDKLIALESVLAPLHVDLVKASSGKEALRRLLRQDFAVILLDVRMPGMDGFETAALIRQRARSEHTPIIFITAVADELHISRGYSLKAVDYILTPVVPEVLRTKVSVFVDLFRMTAQVRRQARSLQQRARQLNRLTTASLAINAALSLDKMAAVAAESAREILRVPRALVMAQVDERRVHRAVSTAPEMPYDERLEATVSSVVARTNLPYRSARGAADGDVAPVGALAAPLAGRDGRNLGFLQVSGRPDGEFTQEDEDLLVQLAQIVSIAIENTLFSEAREANRLKDEFLATVSHELRTPLSAMLSWIWMLRRGGLDDVAHGRALEAIERNAKAQARIVDDLLDVSRIVTGKLRLEPRPLHLGAIVETAVESTLAAAEAKGIEIVTTLDPDAAPVLGDPDRLQQVIWNLVSNAIKFTPRGGRVDVELSGADADVEVRIRDTGRGIPPGFLPHVFEPFRQADGSSTRSAGGLGLGLAIVRHLVELHGGRVHATSAGDGRGATFAVALPAAHNHAIPPLDVVPLRDPLLDGDGALDLGPRLDGLRVLVVEDEPDTREALDLIVSGAGAAVTTASSADEALAVLGACRPHVLLCDIGLPVDDGYVLLGRLRALDAGAGGATPAVALTAYAHATDRQRALAAGFHTHLAKPVEPAALVHALLAASSAVANGRCGDHGTEPARASVSEVRGAG